MPAKITIGCVVSGKVGPKVNKRRIKFEGHVLGSFPGKWLVWWNNINKCSFHTSKELTVQVEAAPMFKKPTKEELDEWMRTDFVNDPAAPVDQPPPTPSPSRLAHPPEVTQQRQQEEPLATTVNNGPAAAQIQLFTGDDIVANVSEKHN